MWQIGRRFLPVLVFLLPELALWEQISQECSIYILFPSPKSSLFFLGEVKRTKNVSPIFMHLCSFNKFHFLYIHIYILMKTNVTGAG